MVKRGTPQTSSIANSPKFEALLSSKKRFLVPLSVFFLVYYFLLPILTSYTKVLNYPAVGTITWAWVFAFSQFIMTWVLCTVYSRRAAEFDAMVEEIRKETEAGGEAA